MTPLDTELTWYTSHSTFSDPGPRAAMLDAVPNHLAAMREGVTPLVFHYRGDGDWAENGIAPERIVGCCRDVTLLFVSLARYHGIPARSRVGFATYFFRGYAVDHVVAEVWNAAEGRWRLVDAELRAGHVDPNDGTALDPLDLTRDQFIVAPDAWLRCREGGDDPERYLVSPFLEIPELRGWPYLLHNVVQDLAALNKHEMVLWDDWGISAAWETITDERRATVDEATRLIMSPNASMADLQLLYAREEFRVPEAVTSWTSAVEDLPVQVTLRQDLPVQPPAKS